MRKELIQIGLFLLLLMCPKIFLYGQSGSPYKLSLEGIQPSSILQFDNSSSLFRLDSIMYKAENTLPLSFRIKQMEMQYQMEMGNSPLSVNIGVMHHWLKPVDNLSTLLDNAAIVYDGYRYKFDFDHGYFGPARSPIVGRNIPKSVYTDILYPWQNAPQSKFFTYKALYLITNFVYPDK